MSIIASGSAHGDRIELDSPLDLPEGTKVEVTITPKKPQLTGEERTKWLASFSGAWANDPGIDAWLKELYEDRLKEQHRPVVLDPDDPS